MKLIELIFKKRLKEPYNTLFFLALGLVVSQIITYIIKH